MLLNETLYYWNVKRIERNVVHLQFSFVFCFLKGRKQKNGKMYGLEFRIIPVLMISDERGLMAFRNLHVEAVIVILAAVIQKTSCVFHFLKNP